MTRSRTTLHPPDLRKTLEADYPDGRWRRVLELLLPTGVADVQQLQQAAGLNRDQLTRFLARCQTLAGDALVARVPYNLPRPGAAGRAPVVYQLGPTGAALLRALGHAEAQPCGLTEPTAIAHARAILDVRLAALAAGLPVQTDQPVSAAGQTIRPDNLVTLRGGQRALFESEQAADLTRLRRVVDSVRRKVAFFRAPAPASISRAVRVVFSVAPGRDWERTLDTWQQAIGIVAAESAEPLPGQWWAMSWDDFAARPDWSDPPDPAQWTPLPGRPPAGRRAAPARQTRTAAAPEPAAPLPADLRQHTAPDDHLILAAFWQQFQEAAGGLGPAGAPQPDPAFFQIMRLIYAASYDPAAAARSRGSYPYAALYLLRTYLDLHPQLREELTTALTRGAGTLRWSTPTILLRMDVVIQAFLKHHGWRSDGSLWVRSIIGMDKDTRGPAFDVEVEIGDPELLREPGASETPDAWAVAEAQAALRWVLRALFNYAADLGLKRPPFW